MHDLSNRALTWLLVGIGSGLVIVASAMPVGW